MFNIRKPSLSSSSSSTSSTTKAPSSSGTSRKPSMTYVMFKYREELKRRRSRYMYLSKTKLLLTDELIAKTVTHITECSVEDLQTLSRETIFKKGLAAKMNRLKRLQHMWYMEKTLKAKASLVKK